MLWAESAVENLLLTSPDVLWTVLLRLVVCSRSLDDDDVGFVRPAATACVYFDGHAMSALEIRYLGEWHQGRSVHKSSIPVVNTKYIGKRRTRAQQKSDSKRGSAGITVRVGPLDMYYRFHRWMSLKLIPTSVYTLG